MESLKCMTESKSRQKQSKMLIQLENCEMIDLRLIISIIMLKILVLKTFLKTQSVEEQI